MRESFKKINLGKKENNDLEEKKNLEKDIKKIKKFNESFVPNYLLLRKNEIIFSPEEFEELCEKNGVRRMLETAKEKNLEQILNACNIKTKKEFEKLCEKDMVRQMLEGAKEKNLEQVLNACNIKTKKEFEELCEKDKARNVLKDVEEKKLEWVLAFFNINTQEKFKAICEKNINSFLTRLPREEIEKGEFGDFSSREEAVPLMELTPEFEQIFKELKENLRKTKGDYFVKTFPKEDLSYISCSFLYSFLALKRKNEKALENLKKRIKTSSGQEKKRLEKISKSLMHKKLELSSFILGKGAIKSLFKGENLNYLLTGKALKISFDYYGILGKELEEFKKEVDKKAEDLIEDYQEKKEEYLLHLPSLLGYAAKYKKAVNNFLKIENLWDFKFSHLEDLSLLLEKVKDLKIEIKEEIELKKGEELEIYFKNLKEHLRAEEFGKAKERILKIKEKNRETAQKLIEKTKEVLSFLLEEKLPPEKDLSFLQSNKKIFKTLNLSSTYNSLNILSKKLKEGGKKKEKLFGLSVEILKTTSEHLSAINIEPPCMMVAGEYSDGALTITKGPILVLAVKDALGKIIGRALLIPIKKEKEWLFELKPVHGKGQEQIEKFVKKMEEKIGQGKIRKDLIKGGELPETKVLPETNESEFSSFYRDGIGLENLKNSNA